MVTIRQRLLFGISAAVVWTVIILVMSYVKLGRWLEYHFFPSSGIEELLWMYGIAALLWTTTRRLDIHIEKQYIKHYIWLFGLKLGVKRPIGKVEKIFINRQKTKEYVYIPNNFYRNRPLEFSGYDYWAFLNFADGEKIKIKSQRNKDSLIKNLKQYNRILKTVIIDTTTDPPEEVSSGNL